MGSLDLTRILSGWEYDPGQITVRRVAGDDGKVRIQMRLDLGLLQMEATGRPDGRRPNDCESLLAYHEQQLDDHFKRNGTELGFQLSTEECQALREESVQYYHRYLAEFVLEDFAGVERDTHRNLRVLDLCRNYAAEENDRVALEQYRPYLTMMNTRAQTHIALRKGNFRVALARVDAGISNIREFFSDVGHDEMFEESTEANILKALREEIAARLPVDPMSKLEKELERALEEERYEDATVLRDRIETMRNERSSAPAKKRRK